MTLRTECQYLLLAAPVTSKPPARKPDWRDEAQQERDTLDVALIVYLLPHRVDKGAAQIPSPNGIVSVPSYNSTPILN
jgi:hypothetical protein